MVLTSLSGSTYSLSDHESVCYQHQHTHASKTPFAEYSHVFVLATDTGGRELLSKALGERCCEALHDARIEGLLDGTTGLLDL